MSDKVCKSLCAGLIVFFMSTSPALAVEPAEMLMDPADEARAREISKELRCVVCQNQSIDDSDAQIARDLRRIVREQVSAGKDNAAIKAYLVERYGEYVLLRPPFNTRNLLLWLGPLLLLVGGGIVARRVLIRLGGTDPAPAETAIPLSDAEQRKLQDILEDREA